MSPVAIRRGAMPTSARFWGGVSRRRRKGGLRRVTFSNSWKSDQKNQKKPMVSSLPCALCIVQNCKCLPHVRARRFVSFHCRIDTAPAPLPLTGAPKELLRLSRGPTGSSAPTQCCRSHFRRARCPHRAVVQRSISYRRSDERQRRKRNRRYVIHGDIHHVL